jgi:hypothetical protein
MIGKPTLRISNTIEYTGQSMNEMMSQRLIVIFYFGI